ncbi:SGNH/GDSL hydrolase family protein [Coraliomargarita sp. W4R53]
MRIYCILLGLFTCSYFAPIHAAELPVAITSSAQQAASPIRLAPNQAVTFKVDLRGNKDGATDYAALQIKAKFNGDTDQMQSLQVKSEDGTVIQQLYIHPSRLRYYMINIRDAVAQARSQEKNTCSITLSYPPSNEASISYEIDSAKCFYSDQKVNTFTNQQMTTPFWKSGIMLGETVFPNQNELPLLASPLENVKLYDALHLESYSRPQDYSITGQSLHLTGDAKKKITPNEVILPATKSAATNRVFPSRHGGYLLSPESTWFQSKQLAIDYSFKLAEWTGPSPDYSPELLPLTMSKLNSNQPIRMVVFGDSITFGANASALSGSSPYQWSWSTLFAQALTEKYETEVELINAALGGTTAEWGEDYAETLVAKLKPDLIILAFGMNGRIPPSEFGRMTQAMIETIRKSNPQAEFILIHSMQPNEAWRELAPHERYGSELQKLEKPGVLFADVWSMHGALLDRKRYFDMTANHVNHPNDFLIRIYAQVIAARLIQFDADN